MAYLIVNQGFADGSRGAGDGRYLERHDPDWTPPGTRKPYRLTGMAWWTNDRAKAQRFPDPLAAFMEWKRQSTVMPIRPWDGKPNRPLTAYTISLEQVPDA